MIHTGLARHYTPAATLMVTGQVSEMKKKNKHEDWQGKHCLRSACQGSTIILRELRRLKHQCLYWKTHLFKKIAGIWLCPSMRAWSEFYLNKILKFSASANRRPILQVLFIGGDPATLWSCSTCFFSSCMSGISWNHQIKVTLPINPTNLTHLLCQRTVNLLRITTLKFFLSKLSSDTRNFCSWCNENALMLNAKKKKWTTFVRVRPRRKPRLPTELPNLVLDDIHHTALPKLWESL